MRQKIEAQIALMRDSGVAASTWADTMQALLDVAVEAEELHGEISDTGIVEEDTLDVLGDMLDKLREVE